MTANYKKILKLKERYDRLYPIKKPLIELIEESELPEHIYDSNAIENSTLSLEETEKILLKIDLDRYISERELFEAKNLKLVVDYTNKKATTRSVDIEIILLLHKILLSNISDDIAGRFRQGEEWVRVGYHIASNPKDVEDLIKKNLQSYRASTEDIIKKLAKFHLEFEHIHPFCDGNGRIGRVLNNWILINEGYIPINIKYIDKEDYYKAFREYGEYGKITVMEEIIRKALSNSYHKRLAYMEGRSIVSLKEYAKSSKDSHNNLLNKANRQTIEAFREKGVWKIGI